MDAEPNSDVANFTAMPLSRRTFMVWEKGTVKLRPDHKGVFLPMLKGQEVMLRRIGGGVSKANRRKRTI
jgi:hypothetical protein